MSKQTTVMITGAAGNLGSKLTNHLDGIDGRYALKLLDKNAGSSTAIDVFDLSIWHKRLVEYFTRADVVVHLAADPNHVASAKDLVEPNLDATINTFRAAGQAGVSRVIFASSNHVMGGYRETLEPYVLTTDLPALPGTRQFLDNQWIISTPYATSKLVGERLGKCHADATGTTVIAVRIGLVGPASNLTSAMPDDLDPWFKCMWLSNSDMCHLLERCIVAEVPRGFHIVNGMSANQPMRWDIEQARQLVGYEPKDSFCLS